MSKNNKSNSEEILRFPIRTEDPIDPLVGEVYLNETKNYVRVFGTGNKWGSFGIAWDVDTTNEDTTDKE